MAITIPSNAHSGSVTEDTIFNFSAEKQDLRITNNGAALLEVIINGDITEIPAGKFYSHDGYISTFRLRPKGGTGYYYLSANDSLKATTANQATSITNLEDNLVNLKQSSIGEGITKDLAGLPLKKSYYIGGTGSTIGQELPNTAFNIVEWIDLLEWKIKSIKLYGRATKSTGVVAFYDATKTFISTINDELVSTPPNIPEGARYVRFSVEKSKVDSALVLEQQPGNPLYKIIEGGLASIFRTIGVVGDSLSSGEMQMTTGETTAYIDMYEYSWIQYLARACGNTALNFSKGGLSTRTFLADAGSQLTKMNTETNKCQAYFIALGHNDYTANIPIGTSADVDLTAYTNNADTYIGNLGEIVQRIKELQPHAFIFLLTMKVAWAEPNGWNDAIRSIPGIFSNTYDNIYVLDMGKYCGPIPAYHYTEGHGNTMGYQQYSKEIGTYLDWLIRNNPLDFKYVQFIGTEQDEYIP